MRVPRLNPEHVVFQFINSGKCKQTLKSMKIGMVPSYDT